MTPPGGSATAVAGLGGEVGAVAELLTTTLPGHRTQLQDVAQQLADTVNAAHQAGYDAAGVAGGPLFGWTPRRRADPCSCWSPTRSASPPRASVAVRTATGATPPRSPARWRVRRRRTSGWSTVFGSEVASTQRLAANQQTLTSQVDGAREQLAGVSLDEEMVTMLQAQRAYEAAARVMTTLDSVLDTLINRTGMVR